MLSLTPTEMAVMQKYALFVLADTQLFKIKALQTSDRILPVN